MTVFESRTMRHCRPLPNAARLRELLQYDPETGIIRWRARANKIAGCRFDNGYINIGIDGEIYGAHRVAWAIMEGTNPSGEIDHINGDPSDNRFCNLRLATSAQNNQNRRLSSRNKTGVKGVFWVTRHRKYRAVVGIHGQYKILGYFVDLKEAAEVVAAARMQMHGEFANSGSGV